MLNLFFLSFISQIIHLIFCSKNEIKFYINNVPSLFRCEKNGPLFYFNHFPTDNEFQQLQRKTNPPCQLSLPSIDQRAGIELDRLELLCEILYKKEHVNDYLFFSSTCSTEFCREFLPSSIGILTEYQKGKINIDRIDLFTDSKQSMQIIIGQLTNDRRNRSVKNGDIRTNQIVFEYKKKNYLNMMCETTVGICQRYYWNQSSSVENDWSWICYYYQFGSEKPLDHNMIYRAVEEFEKTNPNVARILLRNFDGNSSASLNGTNTDLSQSSVSMLFFLILSIGICGTYYFCKKKSLHESVKTVNRSSEDSEYSQDTLEETFDE